MIRSQTTLNIAKVDILITQGQQSVAWSGYTIQNIPIIYMYILQIPTCYTRVSRINLSSALLESTRRKFWRNAWTNCLTMELSFQFKKLYGMAVSILYCSDYLGGSPFEVESDHLAKKLQYQEQLKRTIYERWMSILQQLSYDIAYKKCIFPMNCIELNVKMRTRASYWTLLRMTHIFRTCVPDKNAWRQNNINLWKSIYNLSWLD